MPITSRHWLTRHVQETNLLKAQKDADRYHELDKNDAIAKQQVDYADAALEAAKKQVVAAKANVNAVRANVNFATIVCAFYRNDWYFTGKDRVLLLWQAKLF